MTQLKISMNSKSQLQDFREFAFNYNNELEFQEVYEHSIGFNKEPEIIEIIIALGSAGIFVAVKDLIKAYWEHKLGNKKEDNRYSEEREKEKNRHWEEKMDLFIKMKSMEEFSEIGVKELLSSNTNEIIEK